MVAERDDGGEVDCPIGLGLWNGPGSTFHIMKYSISTRDLIMNGGTMYSIVVMMNYRL